MFGENPVSGRTTSTIWQAVRCLAAETEGAALVELTIVAPMLVMMVVGTMDLGLGVYRKMQVEHAAQAGAQYAIVNGLSSANISTAVTNATTFAGITASPAPSEFCGCPSTTQVTAASCAATCGDGTPAGQYVTVSAKATYTTVVSYSVFPSSFNLVAQSTVRIQ